MRSGPLPSADRRRRGAAPAAPVVETRASSSAVNWLVVRGAAHNNLKNIDVHIPLGRFVCITGVSGSGKSSLVNDILREQLARDLNGSESARPGRHRAIEGTQHLDKVIDIDQTPIGRTPRSNPATYIKLFDDIRDLFAQLPDSKVRGFKPGRFSFNVPALGESGVSARDVLDPSSGREGAASPRQDTFTESVPASRDAKPPLPYGRGSDRTEHGWETSGRGADNTSRGSDRAVGGRCEACQGNGANRIEMDFLADVWVTCPVCEGRRFNRETLAIRYRGKSIADVLDMDVEQAAAHFANIPHIAQKLATLHDVGLDYLKLGQPSNTLSGGEAQRIKLARELVRRSTGRTLYLLDEPTTGLHFEDVRRLLAVLHGFVDAGNSVVVIEHHLDVIKTADWVIDLGPEGGDAGGYIVAEGTPEDVAACDASFTGRALQEVLEGTVRRRRGAQALRQRRTQASRRAGGEPGGAVAAIRVLGAREHNLRDVSVDIPRNAITVCSGVSGSGKSSFAIDTVYAEGHRRYVESLSAYARQFLGQLEKPKVDHVYGLSPAIAIEQKSGATSPRSTVGTVTEVYDYMRVLWARVGKPYCPRCDTPIGALTSDEIVEQVLALPEGSRLLLCAPVQRSGNETYADLLARYRGAGYARVRIDGQVHALAEPPPLPERRRHAVQIVVDRVVLRPGQRQRIADSVEQCLSVGGGVLLAVALNDTAPAGGTRSATPAAGRELRFSQHFSCDRCGTGYEELSPNHFSFNTRLGWCPACEGLGVQRGTSVESIVKRPTASLRNGALAGFQDLARRPLLTRILTAVAEHAGIGLDVPWNDLTDDQRHRILFGTGDAWIPVAGPPPGMRIQFKGYFPAIDEATRISWQYRMRLEKLVTEVPCQRCGGSRIRPEPAAARLAGRTIHEVCRLPLDAACAFFERLALDRREKRIAGEVLREILARLRFLIDVGLNYLTLERAAPTLSGGEAQRIRLASQVGSGLTGVLYVLDEPTIGLHPRDNARLIAALKRLRDLGNTLLMVEHDREVIDAADHVIDFGPGAGRNGGRVMAAAPPERLRTSDASLTGSYLAGTLAIPVPTNRRQPSDARLVLSGARHHNLQNVTAEFPLNCFVCVTGVSGSGKSSLVTEVLYPVLASRIQRAAVTPGAYDEVRGIESVDKVINVDQAPIGMSPLSNPATYTGVFDHVRNLFARLPDAKVRGYTANRFSFNRPGGRCEACEGLGHVRHEMHFLPDVWVTCETCGGARYNRETLDVRYRGRSISDVLGLTVAEALELFDPIPRIRRLLAALADVGLDYMPLGQSAPTLSGGEAQRVKLAAELGRPDTGRTIYFLDEPTTGLHVDDLRKLLDVLHRLVDLGNTVVCVEHNLDVIKTADWVIDLGPEAGEAGGRIVAAGPPETIAATPGSHTGAALSPVLNAGPRAERKPFDPRAAAKAALAVASKARLELDGGSQAAMPWQSDGRRWHTRERPSRDGGQVEWDGAALERVVTQVERLGGRFLAPTNWNDRACVEIRAKAAGTVAPWLLHALTGGRWLLELSFRVPSGTFVPDKLVRQLDLPTLDERDDLPIYGTDSRVHVRSAGAGWDNVRILVHDLPEVSSRGFNTFLRSAVAAYLKGVQALIDAADQPTAPWQADGKNWHLSQRAHRDDQPPAWNAALLIDLLGRIGRLLPGMQVDWNRKTHVGLRRSRSSSDDFACVYTNSRQALTVEWTLRAGALPAAEANAIGQAGALKRGAAGAPDVLTFCVSSARDIDTDTLRRLIALIP